eukprot:TRINITY_DN8442_c0_g1_i2.p1 TRINITY_DN8442_c0_g1~~TRINITY_DN8442_c0_g1_i2.p1  ORF type:complete len:186 (-),score=51.62 TRINITY_DN8442_c0_g1_i2:71-592(-)
MLSRTMLVSNLARRSLRPSLLASAPISRPFTSPAHQSQPTQERKATDQNLHGAAPAHVSGGANIIRPSVFWKGYHMTSYLLLGLLPAGIAFAHHPEVQYIDYALLGLIPLHSHIGLDTVINDYCYEGTKKPVKALLFLLTGATFYGLYKVNTEDVGISKGLRMLWEKKSDPVM